MDNARRSDQWKAWIDSICTEHTVAPTREGKYEPSPNDAFKLAALQWWTHNIGKILIEVYATDRRQFARMSQILSDASAALRSLAGEKKLMADGIMCQTDQDCPGGFRCDEGTCEPLDATE